MLVKNKDESFIWIQYIAFMLDKLGLAAARRVAERAVKSVSISNEAEKMNVWISYMNLENKFGTQKDLEDIVKRAIVVNEKKKIWLQLAQIYINSQKF